MQFKDKLGNCLIQTVTYLSLNWSSPLSVICGGQHVPLDARDTCETIGIPLHPLRLLARPRREFRGLAPALGIFEYSQKRVGNSLRRYLLHFRPTSGRKIKKTNRLHYLARFQLTNPILTSRVIGN